MLGGIPAWVIGRTDYVQKGVEVEYLARDRPGQGSTRDRKEKSPLGYHCMSWHINPYLTELTTEHSSSR